jgi:hypothetical protein
MVARARDEVMHGISMSVHSVALNTAASLEAATSRLADIVLGAVEQEGLSLCVRGNKML